MRTRSQYRVTTPGPGHWKIHVIVKLPKKGTLGDCTKMTERVPINLLSRTSKISSHIILQRTTKAVDNIFR